MLCRDYLCGLFHRITKINICLFSILYFYVGHNFYIHQIISFILYNLSNQLYTSVTSWGEPHSECLEFTIKIYLTHPPYKRRGHGAMA